MPTPLRIAHLESLDPQAWEQENAAGRAPGRSPYGLHRLIAHDFDLSWTPVPAAGRNPLDWLPAAGVLTSRGRPPLSSAFDAGVAIAWDERIAVRLVADEANSDTRVGAGIIWALDQLIRGTHRVRVRLLREVYRRLDFVWCNSDAQIGITREWLGTHRRPLVGFAPMGVDVDFFPVRDNPDEPFVFSLGNDRDRDIATLYAALSQVMVRHPGAQVHVQTSSSLAAPRGITVHRSLSTDQVLEFYRRSSVVVIATRPNVHVSGITSLLEAMATGRPVVTTDNPGMRSYITEGETGFLCDPFDHETLSARISALLDDDAMARSLGQLAAEVVRSRFTEDALCAGIAEIARSAAAS